MQQLDNILTGTKLAQARKTLVRDYEKGRAHIQLVFVSILHNMLVAMELSPERADFTAYAESLSALRTVEPRDAGMVAAWAKAYVGVGAKFIKAEAAYTAKFVKPVKEIDIEKDFDIAGLNDNAWHTRIERESAGRKAATRENAAENCAKSVLRNPVIGLNKKELVELAAKMKAAHLAITAEMLATKDAERKARKAAKANS